MAQAKLDPEIMRYLPTLKTEKAKHSRKFVTTILATLRPEFVRQVIAHAHKQRQGAQAGSKQLEELELLPEFKALLMDAVYCNSK